MGDPQLALKLLQMIDEYFSERQDEDWGIPNE